MRLLQEAVWVTADPVASPTSVQIEVDDYDHHLRDRYPKAVLAIALRLAGHPGCALLLLHAGDCRSQPSHFLHKFQHDPVHQSVTFPGSALDARETLLGQVAVARYHSSEHTFVF